MSESISPQQYRAEISTFIHDIRVLNERIAELEQIDLKNPFKNPTEYIHYNSSYDEINPNITIEGYVIPLEPDKREMRKIKTQYNIAGAMMLFLAVTANILLMFFLSICRKIVGDLNPQISAGMINNYVSNASLVVLNALIFLICNVGFAFIGLKMEKIPTSSLFKTKDFNIKTAIKYCFIAMFIYFVAVGIIGTNISSIIEALGYKDYNVNDYIVKNTTRAKIVMFIYSVIIAPITEEFFCRGMALKLLSRVNQRFGIIFTAVFFGVMHQNIMQFSLGFFMGLFLGHITMKHNSIVPAIIVHMFINSQSYIIPLFYDFSFFNIAYLICILIGLVLFLSFNKKNKIPSTTPHQARRGLVIAVRSLPLMVVMLLHVTMIILNILSIS